MVIWCAFYFAAAVIRKFAGSPSADVRNADTTAVSFMLCNVLDTIFTPHLDFLLLGRCFLAFEV